MKLLKSSIFPSIIFFFGSITGKVFGIEVTTNPVGVIQITALGNSDTLVSLPLLHPATFNGIVESLSGATEVTVSGSPGWTEDVWAGGYYTFGRSGLFEGQYATILSNTADSITVEGDESTLEDVVVGDKFSIHPYWTLGTLFPSGDGVNSATSHVSRDTEVMFPDVGAIGINLAAYSTYYYLGGEWKKVGGDLSWDYRDDILLPDSYFIVRHNTSNSTTITFTGEVIVGNIALPIVSQDISEQDNIIGLQRPIEMTLDQSDLGPNLGANDALYVWDQNVRQKNRLIANADKYTYVGTTWYKNDSPVDGGSEEVFLPGFGFVIRKDVNDEVTEEIWTNPPNYGE